MLEDEDIPISRHGGSHYNSDQGNTSQEDLVNKSHNLEEEDEEDNDDEEQAEIPDNIWKGVSSNHGLASKGY